MVCLVLGVGGGGLKAGRVHPKCPFGSRNPCQKCISGQYKQTGYNMQTDI